MLIDLVDTTVNHGFLNRLQAVLAAYDQFAERQNKVSLERQRVVLFAVGIVDVHGIDILRAGRADFDDLPFHAVSQGRILCLRITDNQVVIRHQKGIGNLSLCRERLAGTGCPENQAVRVFQFLPVHHNQVVGQRIQAVVKRLASGLKQLLCGERNKDSSRTCGQRTLNFDEIICQREAAHEPLFLLEVESPKIAVMLLRNRRCLKHIVFQFLITLAGIHNQEGNQEHALVLRLQLL